MSIGKLISSGLGVLVFAGAMAFALSGAVKGFVFVQLWDGAKTLECGGSFVMTIRDRTITLDQGPVFSVGGDCQLNIVNSTIKAPVVVGGGGNARVVIDGGTIEGVKAALQIGGNATVEIKNGAKIVGPIERGRNNTITGLPADDARVADQVAPAKRDAEDKVTGTVCAELTNCYKQHGAYGQIDAQISAELAADGKITGATLTRGTPPEAVKKCLVDTVTARSVADATLGAGRVICEFSGTFTEGTQMLALGAKFVPAKAGS